jgi:hypothetical protein
MSLSEHGLADGKWVTIREEEGQWSPIPHRSAQVHLDSYNLLSYRTRLTDRPEGGGSTHL